MLGAIAVLTRKPIPVPSLNAQNWLAGRWRPFAEAERERFLARALDATVAEVRAPHYLFLSHRDEVASRVRSFMLGASAAERDYQAGGGTTPPGPPQRGRDRPRSSASHESTTWTSAGAPCSPRIMTKRWSSRATA